jgi:thiosulfate/3-mercaptopyruvate sulfurtransferase
VADVTLEELRRRVGDDDLILLDVRSPREYSGEVGYSCDPRQGHITGARNLPLDRLLQCGSLDELRALVGAPEGREVVAYCHSGSRSRYAVEMLADAGYDARNYPGSWHEWSRDPELPAGSSRTVKQRSP